MASPVSITNLTAINGQTSSAVTSINANFAAIQTALNSVLSINGVAPNKMQASLDMNGNTILNLPAPVNPTDPVRLEDVTGGITFTTTNAVLTTFNYQTQALAAAATIASTVNTIVTQGYYIAGDLGAATYKRVTSKPSYPGYFQSADGAYWQLTSPLLYPQMFGAYANGATDDSTALANWFTAMCAFGRSGRLSGNYYCNNNLTWDFSTATYITPPNSATTAVAFGMNISGQNRGLDGITFATGYGLTVTESVGSGFYHSLNNFFVTGNVSSGPIVRLGDDAFSHALNNFVFYGLVINNNAQNTTRAASIALRVNYCVFCSFINVVCNGGGSGNILYATAPGYGVAFDIRQSVGCGYMNCGAGNCNIAINLNTGANYGNSFDACDIEETNVGVQISNVSSSQNVFNGGTIVAEYPINELALVLPRNIITCTNVTFYTTGSYGSAGALYLNFLGGIACPSLAPASISTPSFPSSGTAYTNTTYYRIQIIFGGGTITVATVTKNSATGQNIPGSFGGTTTVILDPGDKITFTYTGSPAWVFYPFLS